MRHCIRPSRVLALSARVRLVHQSLAHVGLFLVALALLGGCLTPPARWGADEVITRTVAVPTSARDTLHAFYAGAQRCSPDYGVPDCAPAREDGRTACELYVGGLYGGRSSRGLGRVEIHPGEHGATLTMAVGTHVASRLQAQLFEAWAQWAQGRGAEVCP